MGGEPHGSASVLRAWLLGTTALLGLAGPAVAQAPGARPTGGQVVAGQARIAQTASRTTITQGSDRAAIDWRGFDVGSQHQVQFQQPSAGAWTLNRVNSPDPSMIAGRISANGGVAIVNQSGVVFAQGAQVNVGSLIASAANITTQNFMSGRMVFDGAPRPGATVENRGTITVADRGLAALVGPRVNNSGVIRARLGKVALAGAETFNLDLAGDGLLSIEVTQAVRQAPGGATALVTNSGAIDASGGSVLLTAHAASGLVEDLVRNTGAIAANTNGGRTGVVVIRAEGGNAVVGGTVTATGGAGLQGGKIGVTATETAVIAAGARIDASGAAGGGAVQLGGAETRNVRVDGRVAARGTAGNAKGGAATIQAMDSVALTRGARVDVSGAGGGGTALVGTTGVGAGQQLAQRTILQRGAAVRADATTAGNGGIVVVNSTTQTTALGALSARGGSGGGNGGFVEVSGQGGMTLNAAIDVTAPVGSHGTLLLDPVNIRIVAEGTLPGADEQSGVVPGSGRVVANTTGDTPTLLIERDSVENFLGTVTLDASNDIAIDSVLAKANGGLTLIAGNTVAINRNVSVSGDFTVTAGSVTLDADVTVGSGQAISLRANSLTRVSGTLSAANGIVEIGGQTATTVTSVGGSGGGLNIGTDVIGAVANNVTTLRLGHTAAGDRTDAVTGGALTIAAALDRSAATNQVVELAGAAVAIDAAVTTGSGGSLRITAASGDITQNNAGRLTTPSLSASAAQGAIALDNTTAANAIATLASATALNAVAVRSAVGMFTIGNVSGNGVTLTNGVAPVAGASAGAISVTGTVAGGTGGVRLVADRLAIGAAVTGARVILQSLTPARPIRLGGADPGIDALFLSAGSLGFIGTTAAPVATLQIGIAAQSSPITLDGSLTFRDGGPGFANPRVDTLELQGGSITQQAGSVLNVRSLTGAASAGDFEVFQPNNTIDTLGTISATANLRVRSQRALSVGGAVQGNAAGLVRLTSAAALTTEGAGVVRGAAGTRQGQVLLEGTSLTLGAAVDADVVALLATDGAITQTGTVTANRLGASAAGDVILDHDANVIAALRSVTVDGVTVGNAAARDYTLATTGTLTVGETATAVADAITAGAGRRIALTAADLALNATLGPVSGSNLAGIGLRPLVQGSAVTIGADAAGFSVNGVELGLLRAGTGTLFLGSITGAIGNRRAGAITLAGDVLLRGASGTAGRLDLRGASVTQTAGVVDVARLTGATTGAFEMALAPVGGNGGNRLDSLGTIAAGGNLTLRIDRAATPGLSIDGALSSDDIGAVRVSTPLDLAVSASASVTAGDPGGADTGAVHLWGRSVTLAGPVTAGNLVSLVATGGALDALPTAAIAGATISQSGAGVVNTRRLATASAAATTLTGRNAVSTYAGVAFGNLQFRSALDLATGGPLSVPRPAGGTAAMTGVTASGAILLRADDADAPGAAGPARDLTLAADVTATGTADLTVEATGTISLDSDATVSGRATVRLDSGSGIATTGTLRSTGGDIVMTAATGDIVQTAGRFEALDATRGTVALAARDGNIAQSGGGRIRARQLVARASGNALLQGFDAGSGGNEIGVLLGSGAAGGLDADVFAADLRRGSLAGGDFALRVSQAATSPLSVRGLLRAGTTEDAGGVATETAGRFLRLWADALVLDATGSPLAGIVLRAPSGIDGGGALTGQIELAAHTTARGITLGGTVVDTLSLDAATLAKIAITAPTGGSGGAGVLVIGRTDGGAVDVVGDVDLRNATTFDDPRARRLVLLSGGAISQFDNTRLNVEQIAGRAGDGFQLGSRNTTTSAPLNVVNQVTGQATTLTDLPGGSVASSITGIAATGPITLRIGGIPASGSPVAGIVPPAVDANGAPNGGLQSFAVNGVIAALGGTGSRVTLVADALDIGATGRVLAAGGLVEILPATVGRTVTLGGTSAAIDSLGLSAAALARIGDPLDPIAVLRIGRSTDQTAGDINLVGDIDLRTGADLDRVRRLELFAGTEGTVATGNITQTGGRLNVADLAGESRGFTVLTGAGNRVDRLVQRSEPGGVPTSTAAFLAGTSLTTSENGRFSLFTTRDLQVLGDVQTRGTLAALSIETDGALTIGGAGNPVSIRAGGDPASPDAFGRTAINGTDVVRLRATGDVVNDGTIIGTGRQPGAPFAALVQSTGGSILNRNRIVLGWGAPGMGSEPQGVLAQLDLRNSVTAGVVGSGEINAFRAQADRDIALDDGTRLLVAQHIGAGRTLTIGADATATSGADVAAGNDIAGAGRLTASNASAGGSIAVADLRVAGAVTAGSNLSVRRGAAQSYTIGGLLDVRGGDVIEAIDSITAGTVAVAGGGRITTTGLQATAGAGGVSIANAGTILARTITAPGSLSNSGRIEGAAFETAGAGIGLSPQRNADNTVRVDVAGWAYRFIEQNLSIGVGGELLNAGTISTVAQAVWPTNYGNAGFSAIPGSPIEQPGQLLLAVAGALRNTATGRLESTGGLRANAASFDLGGSLASGAAGFGGSPLAGGAAAGSLSLTAAGDVALAGANVAATAAATLTTTSGQLRLTGTTLAAGSVTLDAASGITVIDSSLSGRDGAIVSQARQGTLTLLGTNVDATVDVTLRVNGGSVVQVGGGISAGGTLAIAAGGSIALGGENRAGGAVTVAANGGDLMQTAGSLAGAGVALSAAGSIVQDAAASVRGGSLALRAGGAIALDGEGNAFTTLASLAAGSDARVRGAGFAVTGNADAGGSLTLSAVRDLAIAAVDLTAGTALRLDAGGRLTLSAVGLRADTAMLVGASANIGTVAATIGRALLVQAPGGIDTTGLLTVRPRAGLLPTVAFDTRAAATAGILALLEPDVPGRPTAQQAVQVRVPNAERPGTFGPASRSTAGRMTLNVDAGDGPVFLLLDGGVATGSIVAGRLGLHGAGGEASLTGRLGGLEGVQAATRADVTRPIEPTRITRYRFNGCAVASITCTVFTSALIVPPRPPDRISLTIDNSRLDTSEVIVPNVADTDLP